MALLRNREVAILGKTDGEDVSPTYTVLYADGERENVKLSDLQVTKDEADQLKKANGENVMVNVKVVEDKDLQAVRDSQDRKKIEENQKTQKTEPVAVKNVMVDPAEVTEKATVKPEKNSKAK